MSAKSPSQIAYPKAESTLISSPGSVANELPANAIEMKATRIASPSMRTWPDSFSSATRRRDRPVAATNSRLPRCASPASVPDSATIDQRLTTSGKKTPYLYWR